MSHEYDVSFLDRPEILEVVFPVAYSPFLSPLSTDVSIPDARTHYIQVDPDIRIGCVFWAQDIAFPTILYFHGNGEVATDHGWIALFYHQIGVNLFVADYRGYGLSNGRPTISNLVSDAHVIFKAFRDILQQDSYGKDIFVMGRSLGSMSAIELALNFQEQITGLIIESGTVSMARRLGRLGFPIEPTHLEDLEITSLRRNQSITMPTLIIHGEYDQLIPLSEARDLLDNIVARDKRLVIIPNADHNTILWFGIEQYFAAIKQFVFRTPE